MNNTKHLARVRQRIRGRRFAVLSILVSTILSGFVYGEPQENFDSDAFSRDVAKAFETDEFELEDFVVTATRERQEKSKTSATISLIEGNTIENAKPAHPYQIMNRTPGVWVNVTTGEGHMTGIRQPLTTDAVYLYLENGVPTRSTGFFNHNTLFEINVPQASAIEVIKGPGTALHGSDAIGGVVNVLTGEIPGGKLLKLELEGGAFGWGRSLMSYGDRVGNHGFRGDLNITHTDGWRDATEYDRYSATGQWLFEPENGLTIKTVATYTKVDSQTGANSRLSKFDFKHHPTRNYIPTGFRDVEAFRISAAIEKDLGESLLSVTPYFRHNRMDLLPTFRASFDPQISISKVQSYGILNKYRMDFNTMDSRLIAGLDFEYSPGERNVEQIAPTRINTVDEGGTPIRLFPDFTKTGIDLYDYDVDYLTFAPYFHFEFVPYKNLRMDIGVRYDNSRYIYDDNIDGPNNDAAHFRPDETTLHFEDISPKAGFTYIINEDMNIFGSFRRGFRVPLESQIFAPGRPQNTTKLDPIIADQFEAGIRGRFNNKVDYELSAYYLVKKDDILSFRDPDTNERLSTNNGETEHHGIELGLNIKLRNDLFLATALSYEEHEYETFDTGTTGDFSGNEIPSAPNEKINVSLEYVPEILNGGSLELEMFYLGDYFQDQANTSDYNGHVVFNLRWSHMIGEDVTLFARIMNLLDERYAQASSLSRGNEEFTPADPFSVFGGITYNW